MGAKRFSLFFLLFFSGFVFASDKQGCDFSSFLRNLQQITEKDAWLQKLSEKRRFQEIAWALSEDGLHAQSKEVENYLGSVLTHGSYKIIKRLRGTSTQPYVVEMENGTKAIMKSENAKHEVAAYVIDRMIGLDSVPVTVLRDIGGTTHSFQAFIGATVPGGLVHLLPEWIYIIVHPIFLAVWIMPGGLIILTYDLVKRIWPPSEKTKHVGLSNNDLAFFDWFIGNFDRPTSGNTITAELAPGIVKRVLIDHDFAFQFASPEEIYQRLTVAADAMNASFVVSQASRYAQTQVKTVPSRKILNTIHSISDEVFIQKLSGLLTEEELPKFLIRLREIKSEPGK